MSDEKPQPPKPPGKPTTKTSTVPLKKETVRITLRARPETGAVPPPPASPTPVPKPPAPPAAPATQPLKPAPPAAPAPPAGAKTVPLTPAPPASAKPGAPVAQPTARLTPTANLTPAAPGAAPATRPLPKATVKLQPTQPVSSAPTGAIASAPLSTGRLDLDDDTAETGIMPFAVIALVLALAAFAIELITSQRVFKQDLKTGTPSWAVPNPDFKKRVGTTGVLVEKLKTGEDWVINEGYSFPRTMESSVPIKSYDDFKQSKK